MADASGNGIARRWSLRRRLLITATVVVAGFLLLAGLALEQAFRSSALQASRDRLQARIYLLMGAANLTSDAAVAMPEVLPEPALALPDSGLLAAITDASGKRLWQSASDLNGRVDYPPANIPGVPIAGDARDGELAYFTLSYPVIWELEPGREITVLFQAAESRARFDRELAAFRNTLQRWLGSAAVLLLLLQAAMLMWMLRPLQRVSAQLQAIETGQREQLDNDYPEELRPLTDNLNALMRSNQARLRRYRDALGDLAHSLKTPLAVLRASAADSEDPVQQAVVNEQLERMDQTIQYQLQRASASGRSALSRPVPVQTEIERIAASLGKVYHDKQLRIELVIAPGTVFQGEVGDLIEMVGNLVDNACKWARTMVRIDAGNLFDSDGMQRLQLRVDDDGPGIAAELRDSVIQRGMRADSRVPGQGIGLAVVRDLVIEIYAGRLEISSSDTGGTRVQVIV